MNRRELFQGLCASLVAASIPTSVETLIALPQQRLLDYLRRVQQEILYKIAHPPLIMTEDGKLLPIEWYDEAQQEALRTITKALKEFT